MNRRKQRGELLEKIKLGKTKDKMCSVVDKDWKAYMDCDS